MGLRHSQITGIDHVDNLLPISSNATFWWVLLVFAFINCWEYDIVNVITVFFYTVNLEICYSRRYTKRFGCILRRIIWWGRLSDDKRCRFSNVWWVCLVLKGWWWIVIVCVYTLCTGVLHAVKEFKSELRKFFGTKEEGIREVRICGMSSH